MQHKLDKRSKVESITDWNCCLTFNKKNICQCGRSQVNYTHQYMQTVILFLDEISYEAGLKVQIHSQDEPPFIHELGFGISPGRQTLVSPSVKIWN